MFLAAASLLTVAETASADLTPWRTPFPLRPSVVFGLVERSREFANFYDYAGKRYEELECGLPAGTVRENAADAHRGLAGLSSSFLFLGYLYAAARLKEYCESAVAAIDVVGRADPGRAVRSIALSADQDYCMLTALHDRGFGADRADVDTMFELVFLLQTVEEGDLAGAVRPEDSRLKRELGVYARKLGETLRNRWPVMPIRVEGLDSRQLTTRLDRIKSDVRGFTDLFCRSYRPFVGKRLLTPRRVGETAADAAAAAMDRRDVRPESRFVRHVFRSEACAVKVSVTICDESFFGFAGKPTVD